MSLGALNNGRYVVSGSYDKTIKLLDLETKKEIYCFRQFHKGKSLLVVK